MLPRNTLPFVLVLAAFAVAPATAGAVERTGGTAAYDGPKITGVRCVALPAMPCPEPTAAARGGQVQIRGKEMRGVRTVTFRGRRGKRDDVTIRAHHVRPSHVEARVPSRARSGRLELRAAYGTRAVTRQAIVVKAAARTEPASGNGEQIFPIRGRHDLGQTATNNFGGGRGHRGQDLFARCGTPLAVAEGGTVREAKNDGAAGNFAVITGNVTGRDYVYMHMQEAPLVRKGDRVSTGQPLGKVGDTGRATGCHLHFELWSAPGWYTGGSAMNPLPDLRAWDARDRAHKH